MAKDDIVIAAAVAGELEGIQEILTHATTQRIGALRITTGLIGQQAVRLVVTGPGTANTVHGLTVAIAAKMPELILQTGCAGGFSEAGLAIGDVAVASEEIDVQLGLEPDKPAAAVSVLPFPVIKKTGQAIFNRYPVDTGASRHAEKILKATLAGSAVQVRRGPFITVATVTASTARSGTLYRNHGALVENMEGVGAAHVAVLYDIPFIEIRAVSNRVGDRDKSRWDLPRSFRRCSQAVRLYLENRLG